MISIIISICSGWYLFNITCELIKRFISKRQVYFKIHLVFVTTD